MGEQGIKAGRELNIIIAERVFNWQKQPEGHWLDGGMNRMSGWKIPSYSTDLNDAWMVVEKMNKDNVYLYVGPAIKPGDYVVHWNRDETLAQEVTGRSAPHAICLAALKAVGVTDNEAITCEELSAQDYSKRRGE